MDLQLVGVVDTVISGGNYHGRGIIRLRILQSNIKEYDPRGKQDYYYCVIKNGIAEIYEQTFVSKVDTITIDTKKRLEFYTGSGKKQVGSISISMTDGYYDFIREKTIFK